MLYIYIVIIMNLLYMKGFEHIWHFKGKHSNKSWTHWKRPSLIYGESMRLLGTQWLCDEAGQPADQTNPDEQQLSGYVRVESIFNAFSSPFICSK